MSQQLTITTVIPTAPELEELFPALFLDEAGYHLQTSRLTTSDWDALQTMQIDGFTLDTRGEVYQVPHPISGEPATTDTLIRIWLPNTPSIWVRSYTRTREGDNLYTTTLVLRYQYTSHCAEIEVIIPPQPFLPGDATITVTYPILATS